MEKNFEALEKIAVHMADTAWPDYYHEGKAWKLEEEMNELMEQLKEPKVTKEISGGRTVELKKAAFLPEEQLDMEKVKDEMGDVLFVMLHMANRLGFTASDLIHHATTKLLRRIKDPAYNKS